MKTTFLKGLKAILSNEQNEAWETFSGGLNEVITEELNEVFPDKLK